MTNRWTPILGIIMAMTISAALVNAAVPIVTSITPNSGYDGDSITITGSGFSGVSGVTVAGDPVASFTVLSPTSISITIPMCSFSGQVVVTNGDGPSVDMVIFYSIFMNEWLDGITPRGFQNITSLYFDHPSKDLFATDTQLGPCPDSSSNIAVVQIRPDKTTRRLSTISRPSGLGMDSANRLYFSSSCALSNAGDIYHVSPFDPATCPWPSSCVRTLHNRLGDASSDPEMVIGVHAKSLSSLVAQAVESTERQLFSVPASPAVPTVLFSVSSPNNFSNPSGMVWDLTDAKLYGDYGIGACSNSKVSKVSPSPEEVLSSGSTCRPAGMDRVELSPSSFKLAVVSRDTFDLRTMRPDPATPEETVILPGLGRPLSVAYGEMACSSRPVLFLGDSPGGPSAAVGRILKVRPPAGCESGTIELTSISPVDDDIEDCDEPASKAVRVMFYYDPDSPDEATSAEGAPRADDPRPYHFDPVSLDPNTPQKTNREIILTAKFPSDQTGKAVFFEVRDPDDLVPFDDPAPTTPAEFGLGDNEDFVFDSTPNRDNLALPGLLPLLPTYPRAGCDPNSPTKLVVTAVGDTAKVILRVTKRSAGDDYVVRARAHREPVWPGTATGQLEYPRIVAWTRVYTEEDRMYDWSFDLTTSVTSVTSTIDVWDAHPSTPLPIRDDRLRIFDAKVSAVPFVDPSCVAAICNESGETPLVDSILDMGPFSRIVLKSVLCCPYSAGYMGTNKGAAAAVGVFSSGGESPRTAHALPLDTSSLAQAYGDARVEFKVLSQSLPIAHVDFPATRPDLPTESKYALTWFRNTGEYAYLYLLGGHENTNPKPPAFCPARAACVPPQFCDPSNLEGLATDAENWAVIFNGHIMPPAEKAGQLLAHELGHQFLGDGADEMSSPNAAVQPCPEPTPLGTDVCQMNVCTNPGDDPNPIQTEFAQVPPHEHILGGLGMRSRHDIP